MTAREAIEETGKQVADGINGKDAAKIAEQYTENASLFPPGAPRHDGRKSVHDFWQAAIDMGLENVTLTTVEVEEFGDTASEVGTVSGTVPGEDGTPIELAGKYIVIWKKNGEGDWRLHRDIWNFDA